MGEAGASRCAGGDQRPPAGTARVPALALRRLVELESASAYREARTRRAGLLAVDGAFGLRAALTSRAVQPTPQLRLMFSDGFQARGGDGLACGGFDASAGHDGRPASTAAAGTGGSGPSQSVLQSHSSTLHMPLPAEMWQRIGAAALSQTARTTRPRWLQGAVERCRRAGAPDSPRAGRVVAVGGGSVDENAGGWDEHGVAAAMTRAATAAKWVPSIAAASTSRAVGGTGDVGASASSRTRCDVPTWAADRVSAPAVDSRGRMPPPTEVAVIDRLHAIRPQRTCPAAPACGFRCVAQPHMRYRAVPRADLEVLAHLFKRFSVGKHLCSQMTVGGFCRCMRSQRFGEVLLHPLFKSVDTCVLRAGAYVFARARALCLTHEQERRSHDRPARVRRCHADAVARLLRGKAQAVYADALA